jgi:Tfp pilus assembly protein PilF
MPAGKFIRKQIKKLSANFLKETGDRRVLTMKIKIVMACFIAAARLKDETGITVKAVKILSKNVRALFLIAALGFFANGIENAFAEPTNEIRIVELQGVVELSPSNSARWFPVQLNQTVFPFDHLRTQANSRVALQWSDKTVVPFSSQTEIEILPPLANDTEPGLHLLRGIISFFHRDKPGRVHVIAGGALAGIEGTEFVMQVVPTNDTEVARLSVIDGKVTFSNNIAGLVLTSGEQAIASPGHAPMRTAGFIANNLLQWCFYYPAILDLNDLNLSTGQQNILGASLAAYRSGDLLRALADYPASRVPPDDAEKIYRAALLLAVGQIEATENQLNTLTVKNSRLANALRGLIAAVKRQPRAALNESSIALSTELLAASYYEQSQGGPNALKNALDLARRAVTNSPNFGFGWERIAEMEFSFGQIDNALRALNKSLALSPRNAQALALKGFLLAAQNQTGQAIDWFDRAIIIDSALGNAWLGRGLCRIHRGDLAGGREDLLVAAALEPQRAALRSYLAKAWSDSYDNKRARKELNLAKKLDPKDPTAWLYSALVDEQDNRINEAVGDLEKSQELNENRSVYRSQLLLDQDHAVRSANLARIYQDDGMTDRAFQEAARAVNSDYANYSAHYFLANSYDAMRDPRLVNLRYETAENSEYLLGNLLAPAEAGILSPSISQQEYSRLFDTAGSHVSSETEYLSRGAWLERGAQYGTYGNTSYSLEGFYQSDNGERLNNDLEQMQVALLVKQQLTLKDSAYIQVSDFQDNTGDLAQRYNPRLADLTFRSRESQNGLVNLGFDHEWSPDVHTLLLTGYLPDKLTFSDQQFPTLAVDPTAAHAYPDASTPFGINQNYSGQTKIYFAEAQQIFQHTESHLSILGGRFQIGDIDVHSEQMNPLNFQPYFPPSGMPASSQNLTLNLTRWSAYAYHYWEIIPRFWLVGGVTYDHLEFPENFLYAPLSNTSQTENKILPKAGFVWTPFKDTTVRAAYTRSLTGVSLEQDYRLEPAQVAGFTQAYRDVIPETAVGGPIPGAPFKTYGVALEQKLSATTYLGLTGEILNSEVTRTLGGYNLDPTMFNAIPISVAQHLDYTEKSLVATLNQLAGRDWSFGLSYQITDSQLQQKLVNVVSPILLLNNPSYNPNSWLHQISLDAGFNHPSGFFAKVNATWTLQSNRGFVPDEPGDNFWQVNAWMGYRFAQRRAEISVGLLNLTDQEYRLDPLTPYNEMSHERTFAARFLINF